MGVPCLPERIEGGRFECLWRDWFGRDIVPGPSVQILPGGELRAAGRVLAPPAAGVWTRIHIVCHLGRAAGGTFDVEIATEGRPPQTIAGLPCPKGGAVRRANWIGFLCHGEGTAKIHLDNLKLTLKPL